MRVSVNGYERDHGSKILVEKDLADAAVETGTYSHCYRDKAIIHTWTSEFGESDISVIARVNATMQGNYKLEIRFTLSDIFRLFWLGFKDKALQFAFQSKAKHA
jgi:hypothetical protein